MPPFGSGLNAKAASGNVPVAALGVGFFSTPIKLRIADWNLRLTNFGKYF
jgi:hypothetical protein